MECWVYKLLCTQSDDPDGVLLYVGISDSPSSRMSNHESQKWWWWLVDRIEWQRCESRCDAERAESFAITNELPLFNKSQSTISAWDRLSGLVYLLWAHISNSRMHPWCPFCDSHGVTTILSPDSACEIFRRNCDDKAVIHFVVSCDMHGVPMQWAMHIGVCEFLIGFGKVPEQEVFAMMNAALDDIPWEKRLKRAATLAEMAEHWALQTQQTTCGLIESK